MPVTYKPIATVTVGSGGAATIDFQSISSTYTDLLVKFSLRETNNNDYFGLAFNNSTSTFTSRYLSGSGSTVGSGSRTDQYQSATVNPSAYTASTFANGELYVPNYAGSTNKSFSIDTVTETNGTTAYAQLIAGLWSTTTAINRITFNAISTFAQYSTATLYGIKNS